MCLIVEFCDKVRADRAKRLGESAFSHFQHDLVEDYLSGCVLVGRRFGISCEIFYRAII